MQPKFVMPGLDPGIHASVTGVAVRGSDVDGGDEPGRDGQHIRPLM